MLYPGPLTAVVQHITAVAQLRSPALSTVVIWPQVYAKRDLGRVVAKLLWGPCKVLRKGLKGFY